MLKNSFTHPKHIFMGQSRSLYVRHKECVFVTFFPNANFCFGIKLRVCTVIVYVNNYFEFSHFLEILMRSETWACWHDKSHKQIIFKVHMQVFQTISTLIDISNGIEVLFTKFKYLFLFPRYLCLKLAETLSFCVCGERNRGIRFAPWTLV